MSLMIERALRAADEDLIMAASAKILIPFVAFVGRSGGAASDTPLNDLFEFRLHSVDGTISSISSEDLSSAQQGDVPSARACHVFGSLLGNLYVHGGSGLNGKFMSLGLYASVLYLFVAGYNFCLVSPHADQLAQKLFLWLLSERKRKC